MKILYFTKYTRKGASSRLRSFQYIPYLQKQNIEVSISSLFDDIYLENRYKGKPIKYLVIKAYIQRFLRLFTVRKYDVIFIEYELFPYLPGYFEKILNIINIPFIVDYDDAIFHNYDMNKNLLIKKILNKKIDHIMKNSSLVIVGNSYLREKAIQARARKIVSIPTVIDVARYTTCNKKKPDQPLVIGWIGSPSTVKYLYPLKSVFQKLIETYNIHIHIVGSNVALGLGENESIIPWSEESEIKSIMEFDIGIMPLSDTPWEKGKCGYKLIQYMGCGLPVIGSAIGANLNIIKHNYNGFLVNKSPEEWFKYIELYIVNPSLRKKHGRKGREIVEEEYNLSIQASLLIQNLQSLKTKTPCVV